MKVVSFLRNLSKGDMPEKSYRDARMAVWVTTDESRLADRQTFTLTVIEPL
jgi:hypothetical protein